MLLGLLMAAGTPASTGCFNGGAFVGAQAGFAHVMLKKMAKDKAISKDDALKVVDALALAASGNVDLASVDATDTKVTNTTGDNTSVYVTIPKGKAVDADAIAQATADELSKLKSSSKLNVSSITFKVDAADKAAFDALINLPTKRAVAGSALATAFAKDVLTAFGKDKDKSVAARVALDAEEKYTSNNGFAGLHAGYLGRVNDKFLVGGLVEGNWIFGQDMKNDTAKTTLTDTKARFNVGAYLRAMFNLTEKFMAGADLGFSGQEIRQLKEVGKTDKESKWFWNPAARLVLGVTLTDNILATAHFGGVFPMIKQDSLKDSAVKAKYSNFHGGVGISYVFGG